MSAFAAAFAAIDALHAGDPQMAARPDGSLAPAELVYAERMTEWLGRLAPDAGEDLRLAVRAQHLCRFELPRDRYPRTREGYRAWREGAADLAADRARTAMIDAGYHPLRGDRVASLVRKYRLKVDPEAQLLEDVACIVFLEHYFAEFRAEQRARDGGDEKLVEIVRKTWRKMSDHGRAAALTLPLGETEAALVQRALSNG